MNEEEFWSFIDSCGASPDIKNEVFHDRWLENLKAKSPDDLIALDEQLSAQCAKTYRWDLWGVAYIMNGGCSDDGFLYFRLWLISRGRDFYTGVLANVDSIAEFTPENIDSPILVEIDLDISSVWEEKTGKDPYDEDAGYPSFSTGAPDPVGESWDEEGDDLKQRFPKTYARYWDDPIDV